MKHRAILESEGIELLRDLPTRDRITLVEALKTLASAMLLQDSEPVRTLRGHPIYQKQIRNWVIWYWVDGPDWEVRIVEFKKVR